MWRRTVAVLGATTALATSALVVGGPGFAGAVSPLPSVSNVTAVAAGTSATIGWTAPAGEPADVVYVVGAIDAQQGWLTTQLCGGCSSLTWSGLRANEGYMFVVAPWSPSTDIWGNGVGSPVITTSDPLCAANEPSGHVCLGVDGSSNLGAEEHAGSGLLHGVSKSTSSSVLASIKPLSWRISALNTAEEPLAVASGAAVTLVLSDAWMAQTYKGSTRTAASPWSSWSTYTSFVTKTVQTTEAAGYKNVYWDIQNEPETPGYYDPAAPPTSADVLHQYLVAYNAIKAADPAAKVIGPSIDYNINYAAYPVDMRRFLDFAAANNLHFDALSWHENVDGGNADQSPQAIADHVTEVRQYLARYPSLGNPPIYINEYGGAVGGQVPGWIVSYVAGIDKAGVAQADRSCWGTGCTTNLDGLVTSSGATTAAGVTYQTYAAMTGRRLAWSSGDDHVDAVATADSSGVVHLLVGRSQVCPSWTASGCPSSTKAPAAETVDLTVGGLGSASSVSVTTSSLPSSAAALSAPKPGPTTTVTVTNGVAKVSLPALADGAALVVTVTPSGGSAVAATR